MNNLRELLLARAGKRIKVNWITGMGSGLPGAVKSVGDDYFVLTAKERGDALTDFHVPFASVLHFRDLPDD